MKDRPAYKEPISTALRRHPGGEKEELINTIRWVGYSAIGIFLTLIVYFLLENDYLNVLAISIGLIPLLLSLALLKRDRVSIPSTILAVTIILMITWLATFGQGIHDIGILGYPVILIVAGLFLRGRVIMYLAFGIILCLAWLVFGDLWGFYDPKHINNSMPEDFLITTIIILIAGNAVYRLVRNVYHNLAKSEREIESRKIVEQQREKLIKKLTSKNQELDRFAIRVSHDLKTPLITIAGFLGYLEKDIEEGNTDKAEKDFAQINEAAKTMGIFVDELLDLSRVGRITNPPAHVSFDDIVQDALKAVDGLLRKKQVQVEVDAAFPFVHADRSRIVQVMQNLIANAVKFIGNQPKPNIRIGVENVLGEYIFHVQDNGIGIYKEHHESVFELFSKLDSQTDGTGIGLGLVKRIIEVHNGRIWVESEPGKGATFKFTLQ
jgi:signal transduction histidine kinase